MKTLKPLRLLGAATFLSVSALAAMAQTTSPAPSSPPAEKPPMVKPEAAPAPQRRRADASPADTSAAAKVTTAPAKPSDDRSQRLVVGWQQGR